jgi:hypothetical protein
MTFVRTRAISHFIPPEPAKPAKLEPEPAQLGGFTIPEFGKKYGLSRSTIYNEIASGRLAVMKVRGRTIISYTACLQWQALCERVSA